MILFDDIPLLVYETEVFCECGAWLNLTHMEESLILQELMELYDATTVRQTRIMETMAMAMGGSMGGMSSGSNDADVVLYGKEDMQYLPPGLGLGYEVA